MLLLEALLGRDDAKELDNALDAVEVAAELVLDGREEVEATPACDTRITWDASE